MFPVHLHTRTQTSWPLSNCSTDDLVVKSGSLLHKSLNDVVYVRHASGNGKLLKAINFNDGRTDFH